ncbi:hypothetical protein FEM48_Zijuj11G0115800 [Ziziphus jujuba var. spinosa]|uniref:Uncharacterized protein n=1 Tax=Ziziphus jujuba var. spinosa TaxID=714518 RepID=A0A978UIQ1_ZIZJJ|nr:hypothetical protein FEM48_Zijuj11G0115800 [Ziziphus jujuba var. spinosa]
MEDFVTDSEASSVLPSSKEEDHEKEKEDANKAQKKEDHLFSRLIHGGEAEAEKEDKEEEKSGGIITNFISNLVAPLSPKAGQVTEQEHEVDEIGKGDSKSVEDGGNGGGIINNLISNLFHQRRKKAKIDKEEGEERGGIIDSFVSHLPRSLPDDAAPTTDEAFILIHSIVKD